MNEWTTNGKLTILLFPLLSRLLSRFPHYCSYKKGSEWRAPLASSDANAQQANAQKKRKFALGLQRHMQNATAAPDAQFLDLLQYRGTGNNRKTFKHSNQRINLRQPWKTPRQNVETMPMTLADGTRVYLKRNRKGSGKESPIPKPQSSCTLGVTMKDLLRRVDSIKRRQIHIKNQLQPRGGDANDTKYSNLDSTLWVDKHAPSSFPQLLSDERTNREVLRALRGWDPYVFGKTPMPERKSMYNGTQNNQYNSNAKSTGSKENDDSTATNPNDKRPAENARVILLSGPPGVGEYIPRCCLLVVFHRTKMSTKDVRECREWQKSYANVNDVPTIVKRNTSKQHL